MTLDKKLSPENTTLKKVYQEAVGNRDTAAWLAYIVTGLVAAATLLPYVWNIPERNMNLITQAQTTLWNGWMLVLAHYYKSKQNNPIDAATIATQAETIKTAQSNLPSMSGVGGTISEGVVKLEPGDEVKVEGVEPKPQ